VDLPGGGRAHRALLIRALATPGHRPSPCTQRDDGLPHTAVVMVTIPARTGQPFSFPKLLTRQYGLPSNRAQNQYLYPDSVCDLIVV